MAGYLATVTSAAEQAFLNTLNPNGINAWLGGADIGTEGTWLWMDGPEAGTQFWNGGVGGSTTAPFNYANWAPTEPNDNFGNEDALVGWWDNNGDLWNDLPASSFAVDYYVVEYNAAATVAEPVTLGLFGLGLAGLGIAARRRR